ncbi:MAG: HNH endonuclease [Methylotenera sp.]|nr:HNH endonuclease [Oligoflexia bacterium]
MNFVKRFVLSWVLPVSVSFLAISASALDRFPQSPDPALTPGAVCKAGKVYRYPEHVLYCSRSVGSALKQQIMANYDARLGFVVTQMNRREFKIDHYIPLCMGGSNDITNLWPQHQTVYQYTDRIEMEACNRMFEGRLKQAEAIELIKRAKANPSQSQDILKYVMINLM